MANPQEQLPAPTCGMAQPPLPQQTRARCTTVVPDGAAGRQGPMPGGMLHPGLYGHGGASTCTATFPCFIPRLSWVAGSTISVIPPVLSHLANSDPVFPGVLFLMELEIIWALLFACMLADGGYGWRQRRGAARRPFSLCHLHAHHRTPEPPLLRPAVKPCPQQLLHLQLNV